MSMNYLSFVRYAALAAMAAGLLAGCATTPRTPEEIVKTRANERWQAILGGKPQAAYEYLSPGSRALVPFRQWQGSLGSATSWKGAKVFSVTCETSEKCIARVEVQHEPLLMRAKLGTITSSYDETWLLDGGQWWMLYKR